MDQPQYSKLLDALAAVPDPRHAHGTQGAWACIVGVISCALLCQQQRVAAMAQWAHQHAPLLIRTFQPIRLRVPRESTLRRALRHGAVGALQQQLTSLTTATQPPYKPILEARHGLAVDGT
jgi:hypothetical protein